MTIPAEELIRIRSQLNLTKVQFGRQLDLIGNHHTTYKVMTEFENGSRLCALPMARLAWLLSTLPELPDWPDYLVFEDVSDN
jgi:hypothetical protein